MAGPASSAVGQLLILLSFPRNPSVSIPDTGGESQTLPGFLLIRVTKRGVCMWGPDNNRDGF